MPEGYKPYYGDTMPKGWGLCSVDDTWWRKVAARCGYNILVNDSWSGSPICNTLRPNDPPEYTFVRRMDKYISDGFFDNNEIDTFFIFGGTNDSWRDCPIGENKYVDFTDEDLLCVLPAFSYLVSKIKSQKNIKRVVAIINCGLKPEIANGMIEACKHYQIECVVLADVEKYNGHPTELGMTQICEQIASVIE